MWDPYANFESTTLPNGLEVHVLHIPDRPWVAAGFLIHSGAWHDSVGLEGTAHFVEHLVSENGGNTAKGLKEFFASHGGEVYLGGTGYNDTTYSFFAPAKSKELAEAFRLFGNTLIRNSLELHVERERKVIVGEFYQQFPTPTSLEIHGIEYQALCPNSWLLRFPRPLGSLAAIAKIAQDDLQRYYDSYYTPANMSIVCVGGRTLDEIVTLLQDSPFADSKPGSRAARQKPSEHSPIPLVTSKGWDLKEIMPGVDTAVFQSTANIPGRIRISALSLFLDLLRPCLFEEFRAKRSWTYSVGCSFLDYYEFYLLRIGSRGLVPSALDSIDVVVADCIKMVLSEPDAFERARDASIADVVMSDLNGRQIHKTALDTLARTGSIRTNQDDIEGYKALRFGDILDLGQYLSADRRFTTYMRP